VEISEEPATVGWISRSYTQRTSCV